MAIDYADLAQVALELIEEAGRTLTVAKRPTAPADAAKPWSGPGAALEATEQVKGVILNYHLTGQTAEFIRRGHRRCLVAAASTTTDLTQHTVLIDGADRWEIVECSPLEPGTVRLLYEFMLKR